MTDAETYRLNDRYARDEGTVFMTGIEALARLPIEQLRVDRRNGLNTAAFTAGYPGSPLGGLDGALAAAAREASDLPIELRPSVNEEYAATAVDLIRGYEHIKLANVERFRARVAELTSS